MKVTFGFFLILGLLFSGGFMSVMLYAKISGQDVQTVMAMDAKLEKQPPPEPEQPPAAEQVQEQPKTKAMIDAPVIAQKPELPSGCEITSIAMMLHYKGIKLDKMQLYDEMPKDPTPIVWNKDGTIASWGHPNIGYVGDGTGKSKGFGIYHKALFPLLKSYIPSAVDLTGESFDVYEKQIANGRPVVVWTTIGFTMPTRWSEWNTSIGPIRATFSEHAVLMVGYDETSVYVNDPWTGSKNVRLDKKLFIDIWEAMGKQGLSYTAD
ncbi:C39 family peptidase [Paenibacillus chitinolyticus]|uniref:C39 family peptidase n=1 Tax=Paenibacillus chitinolyticus TaxID=79263 RepID=UPI003665C4D2